MSKVLVIGDLHAPAVHPRYLQFAKKVARRYKTTKVVFIGDIADQHFATRHLREVKSPGSEAEVHQARAEIGRWHAAFPGATVVIGNHDRRHERRAAEAGIPAGLLHSQNEIWGTPTWIWVDRVRLDGVLFVHGDECGAGVNPALALARGLGESVVAGHHHSKAGIAWANPLGRQVFGMQVGCGCDEGHAFFRYSRMAIQRGIIGCGVVLDGVPHLEVMSGV